MKRFRNFFALGLITAFTLFLCAEGLIARKACVEVYRLQEDKFEVSLWNGVTEFSRGGVLRIYQLVVRGTGQPIRAVCA